MPTNSKYISLRGGKSSMRMRVYGRFGIPSKWISRIKRLIFDLPFGSFTLNSYLVTVVRFTQHYKIVVNTETTTAIAYKTTAHCAKSDKLKY